jgi:hypothetical protein
MKGVCSESWCRCKASFGKSSIVDVRFVRLLAKLAVDISTVIVHVDVGSALLDYQAYHSDPSCTMGRLSFLRLRLYDMFRSSVNIYELQVDFTVTLEAR